VMGAFAEPSVRAEKTARELTTELRDMADWLELDAIDVAERGDLAPHLHKAQP